jgi:hypothetical protein
MRRDVRSARFVYRAFDADRPDDADPFAGALASNRRAAGAAAAGDEVAATLERR